MIEIKDEKILENELMTDEELEKVSGGYDYELASESCMLYRTGFIDKIYFKKDEIDAEARKKIQEGWFKAGIICVARDKDENLYFLQSNGKQISSEKAFRYVAEKFPIVR